MDVYSSTFNSSETSHHRHRINPLLWNTQKQLNGKLFGYSKMDAGKLSYSKTRFYSAMYHSFGQSTNWSNLKGNPHNYGAVFNFDFTADGSTLVAASERRSILMFDPLTQKKFRDKKDAHDNCVNVIKFIDSRLFATCSDDRTVKIWDLRNTDKEVQTLHGHSNWVKNIECVDSKLITSGFDGNIIVWDYNKLNDQGEVPHHTLFQTRNLMRTALSPDGTKLIMSTSSGYIMVIHDLDIDAIADDLNGFKPNIYRLMSMNPKMGNNTIPYNHLFHTERKSNRLELVADFTDGVDVEIIASLKIHPSGDYIVSRNTSSDEKSEHTCVHDLRDSVCRKRSPVVEDDQTNQSSQARQRANPQYLLSLAVEQGGYGEPSTHSPRPRTRTERIDRLDQTSADRNQSRSRSPHRTNNTAQIPAAEANEVLSRVIPGGKQRIDSLAANYSQNNEQFMIFIQGGSDGVHQTLVLFADDQSGCNSRRRVADPYADTKLAYYVEEPNMGRGFIKEQCFSHDGRIVCSPFAHGVRLLGFDPQCRNVDENLEGDDGHRSRELQEITSIYTHQNLVVSTKYSPTHHLLVTGCLDGQVSFHQPVL